MSYLVCGNRLRVSHYRSEYQVRQPESFKVRLRDIIFRVILNPRGEFLAFFAGQCLEYAGRQDCPHLGMVECPSVFLLSEVELKCRDILHEGMDCAA